jgi:hypothetical protein
LNREKTTSSTTPNSTCIPNLIRRCIPSRLLSRRLEELELERKGRGWVERERRRSRVCRPGWEEEMGLEGLQPGMWIV